MLSCAVGFRDKKSKVFTVGKNQTDREIEQQIKFHRETELDTQLCMRKWLKEVGERESGDRGKRGPNGILGLHK